MYCKKKTKISIIVPTHWSKMMGGAQYQAKCLLEELLKNSNEYEIHFLSKRIDSCFVSNEYSLHRISNGIIKKEKFNYFIFDSIKLYNLLKTIKPDTIYQRVGCTYTGIAAFYAKKYGCNMVWHIAHDTDITPLKRFLNYKNFIKYLEKKILEYGILNSNHIIAQTNYQNRLLKQNYGIAATAVIPNFHPLPSIQTKKDYNLIKIVWIANIKPIKQPEIFIQMAEELGKEHHNISFIMIGAPSKEKPFWQDQLEKRINNTKSLTYYGKLPIEKVNSILSESHLFVNTSLEEGFANTFIQSWMRKVPVISLHVNPDNILKDQNIGKYCKTYKGMINEVKYLISHIEEIKKMGENAFLYAKRVHSISNVDKVIKYLRS